MTWVGVKKLDIESKCHETAVTKIKLRKLKVLRKGSKKVKNEEKGGSGSVNEGREFVGMKGIKRSVEGAVGT